MSDREVRLKFYGLGDYGTYFQLERAFKLIADFNPARADYDINEVIELHNAVQYVEHDLWPKASTEEERSARAARLPDARRVIGTFFNGIDDSTFAPRTSTLDFQYHADALDLLARRKVFERCSASVVIEGLREARFHLGDLLSSEVLVRSYEAEVRALILSEPRHAEQLIAKYFQADQRRDLYLPKSFTAADSRALIDSYLDSKDPNPNFVDLVATARVDRNTGVDARLKLKAQRKHDAAMEELFKDNEGIKTGCEVSISKDQVEPVVASLEGMVGKYTYSQAWLAGNLDHPTVLNNFIYLFEFATPHMLLNLPSFYADLGVFERFMGTPGRESYRTGAAFRHTDMASLLQTVMYTNFLRSEQVELEEVIAWFFSDYLSDQFNAENLRFRPSSPTSTYLERCRHLFSEMESVLKQFALFVEHGELDVDLLAITSESMSYVEIPSMLDGKYVYSTDDPDIQRIQHLVFSDQSGLGYIDEELKGDNFAALVIEKKPQLTDFAEYQTGDLDFLVDKGVVTVEEGRVRFSSAPQFGVLQSLSKFEAANYYHHTAAGRAAIDAMVIARWLERRSSLLTVAEASYFNYNLNQSEFSNGPDLRNRYLHGVQVDGEDDQIHRRTYYIVLRLLVALAIKINDDFDLKDDEDSASPQQDLSS